VKPVALPCGATICHSHIDQVLNGECHFCKQLHTVPEGGFKVNDVLQKVVDIQVNSILSSPIFIDCQNCIETVKATIEMIDIVKNTPEVYIAEYFDRVRHLWDERSTDVKCKQETKEKIKFRTEVDACEAEFGELLKRFETLLGKFFNYSKNLI